MKYVVIGVHQDKSGNTTAFVNAGAQVIVQENEKAGLAAPMVPTSSSLRATAGWRPIGAMEALAGCTML